MEEKFEEIKETAPVHEHAYGVGEGGYFTARIVYYLFGILEVLLAFRLLFRLLAANPGNAFVSFIYDLSYLFVAPFQGIFPQASAGGAVLEPATLIAIVLYGLIAWGLVRLVYYVSHAAHADHLERMERTETRYRNYNR